MAQCVRQSMQAMGLDLAEHNERAYTFVD